MADDSDHLGRALNRNYRVPTLGSTAGDSALLDWSEGKPGDPSVRLNNAIAFIAQKGLATEFALWLRKQE